MTEPSAKFCWRCGNVLNSDPPNGLKCVNCNLKFSAEPSAKGEPLSFAELRNANISRCSRWHPRGLQEWSLSDWGVATAGEMGEALNIIKKLNRERDGIAGNTATIAELKQALADEIADVAIYLDILAASEGIDLAAAIVQKFNRTSKKVGFPERLAAAPSPSPQQDDMQPTPELYGGLPREKWPTGPASPSHEPAPPASGPAEPRSEPVEMPYMYKKGCGCFDYRPYTKYLESLTEPTSDNSQAEVGDVVRRDSGNSSSGVLHNHEAGDEEVTTPAAVTSAEQFWKSHEDDPRWNIHDDWWGNEEVWALMAAYAAHVLASRMAQQEKLLQVVRGSRDKAYEWASDLTVKLVAAESSLRVERSARERAEKELDIFFHHTACPDDNCKRCNSEEGGIAQDIEERLQRAALTPPTSTEAKSQK